MMVKALILYVEDEPRIRKCITAELRQWFPNYDVDSCSSVTSAKRLLRRRISEGCIPRVIVLDEVLSGDERGTDLAVYLHRRYPGIKKVLLTSHATPRDVSRAVNEGQIDRYILKEDYIKRPLALRGAIREVLRDEGGTLQQALIDGLNDATNSDQAQAEILAACKETISPTELVQHIELHTRLGQQLVRHFADLILQVLQDPSEFLAAVERAAKSRQAKARQTRSSPKKARA